MDCAWSPASPKKQFLLMSNDIQPFSKAFRKAILSNRNGSPSDMKIYDMAVPFHNSHTDKMEYEYKDDNSRERWVLYDAFIA